LDLFMENTTKLNFPFSNEDAQLIFFENRPLIEKMQGKTSPTETRKEMLETALSKEWHQISKILISELFSDEPELIDRICHYWRTTDEMYFYFSLYKEKYGQEALKKFIADNCRTIMGFNQNLRGDAESYRKFLEFLKNEGIEASQFVDGKDFDFLRYCEKLSCMHLWLETLPEPRKKEFLLAKGGELFYNLRRDTAENCESFLKEMQSEGIPLKPVLEYRQKPFLDPLTFFDFVCLDGRIEHLKVILKYIDDESLWTLLHTRNHGLRDPFGHCRYYNPGSGALELISAEYERIKKTMGVSEEDLTRPILRLLRLDAAQ